MLRTSPRFSLVSRVSFVPTNRPLSLLLFYSSSLGPSACFPLPFSSLLGPLFSYFSFSSLYLFLISYPFLSTLTSVFRLPCLSSPLLPLSLLYVSPFHRSFRSSRLLSHPFCLISTVSSRNEVKKSCCFSSCRPMFPLLLLF